MFEDDRRKKKASAFNPSQLPALRESASNPSEGESRPSSTTDTAISEGRYITVARHRETQQFHGLLAVNHPTPSGCDRWLTRFSDPVGFETKEAALKSFLGKLPEALRATTVHM